MNLETYQHNLFSLLFGTDPEASVAALSNPRGRPDRWRRYRQMVRDRLEEVAENSFPRLREALGETWPAAVARWLSEAPPRSPYLRDVHGEFARWAEGALPDFKGAAPWSGELARYEWALLDTSYAAEEQAARDVDPAAGAFAMGRPAVLTPAHRLLRLQWSVHRAQVGYDLSAIVRESCALCVYRDPVSHDVRVLELGAFAAALLEGIARGPERALLEVFREAAEASDQSIDVELVESFAELVADLMDRGVWLGSSTAAARGVR
ncbi:MAG: putative DNA-binding domain-containing protein [Myxococcales bacterium]|nr:putative DNA-binding domain-containing protein [Myxococcales bacterium]